MKELFTLGRSLILGSLLLLHGCLLAEPEPSAPSPSAIEKQQRASERAERKREFRRKQEEARIAVLETKLRHREEAISRYPEDEQKLMRGHKVWIGMTDEQATLSWGDPESKNQTITANGMSEQWVYPAGRYLYFDDHILTSIQNVE